jgi:3-oxoacyl-[acyl-carrier protein] reductase
MQEDGMNGLRDKVAVVTGSGRGIGRAVAERLAADGANVVVNYGSSGEEADDLVRAIEGRGGRALAVRANVTKQAEVQALFSAVDEHFGRLDILVNNAGIAEAAPLEAITEEMIDRVFAVNVKGVVFAAQEAARRLGAGGRIVNVSSSTADFPLPGLSVYAGSKAVPKVFAQVWARELAPRGITVNSVVPGPTSPGMIDRAPEHLRAQVAGASPFGRMGTAEEVAAVVAFLCSDDARWVSGQNILVNGAGTV